MIIGGRMGYIVFYNLSYYLNNPIDIFKIWEGGMSFHGALIGIIIGTYFFSKKFEINTLFFFRYYCKRLANWYFFWKNS